MTFADALQRAMDMRGINSKSLSELSGVQPPYISKLLNGKVKEPTWARACALIDALEMTPDEFRELQESE